MRPEHMAVDKPSDKFLAFLRKHYGLSRTIPQINNFVVFDSFFQDRPSKCLLLKGLPPLFLFLSFSCNIKELRYNIFIILINEVLVSSL